MSILVEVNKTIPTPTPDQFPALRQWVREHTADGAVHGPLIVLFLDQTTGIALSGVPVERIGKQENWVNYRNPCWAPVSITISSVLTQKS